MNAQLPRVRIGQALVRISVLLGIWFCPFGVQFHRVFILKGTPKQNFHSRRVTPDLRAKEKEPFEASNMENTVLWRTIENAHGAAEVVISSTVLLHSTVLYVLVRMSWRWHGIPQFESI